MGNDEEKAKLLELVKHYHYGESEVERLKVLLASGAATNIVDKTGNSPLMYVARYSASFLKENHPFHIDRSVSHCLVMIRLLLDFGANVNAVDRQGRTAFMHPEVMAIADRSIALLLALLPKSVDINIQDGYGNTALMYAAIGSYVDCVRTLLSRGANVNLTNHHGLTAFELLAQHCSGNSKAIGDVASALLEGGATTRYENEKIRGGNPYSETTLSLRQELARHSVKYEPAVSEDKKLLDAAIGDRPTLAEAALKHGADANVKSVYGDTPLMLASVRGNCQIVKLLLKHGADTGVADEDGKTALTMAQERGHQDVVELLLG